MRSPPRRACKRMRPRQRHRRGPGGAAHLTVVYPHQLHDRGRSVRPGRNDGAGQCLVRQRIRRRRSADDRRRTAHPLREMPDSGPDSITVPGIIAAGARSRDLVPHCPSSIFLLRRSAPPPTGFPVSPSLARGIRFRRAALMSDAGIRALFLPAANPWARAPSCANRSLHGRSKLWRATVSPTSTPVRTGDRLATGLARLGSPLRSRRFRRTPQRTRGSLAAGPPRLSDSYQSGQLAGLHAAGSDRALEASRSTSNRWEGMLDTSSGRCCWRQKTAINISAIHIAQRCPGTIYWRG